MGTTKVEIFSDYLWALCWLAKPAVDGLVKVDPNSEVHRRVFRLRPGPVSSLGPMGEHLPTGKRRSAGSSPWRH